MTTPPRRGAAALRALCRIRLPLISIPEASTGAPFFGSRASRTPGPALPTTRLSAMRTSSVGCPRSAARIRIPAPASPRRPSAAAIVFRSIRRPIGPKAEITFRLPPLSVESANDTRAAIPPNPRAPEPIRTLVVGDPSIVSVLSATSCPRTVMPVIARAAGTRRCSPLIEMRTGAGSRIREWEMKKTPVALVGRGLPTPSRASPGPRATMQAPSDVIDVPSRETHRPRVA